MWPILFSWGPITIHSYGALVALGFLAGYGWTVHMGRRSNISDALVLDLVWVLLLSGILGARLLYVLFNIHFFAGHPLDIFKIWQGGLVWYGGLITAALAGGLWTRWKKIPLGLAADICAPGAALGHALGRLGCFAAGCCYGKSADIPWAVVFTHSESLGPLDTPLHPTQIYEALLNLVLWCALSITALRGSAVWLGRGRLAAAYVFLYGAIRLAVEFFRNDDRGPVAWGLTATQWVAVSSMLMAALFWVWDRKRARV